MDCDGRTEIDVDNMLKGITDVKEDGIEEFRNKVARSNKETRDRRQKLQEQSKIQSSKNNKEMVNSDDDNIEYNDSSGTDDLCHEDISRYAQEILDWEPCEPTTLADGLTHNEFDLNGWVGLLHLDYILTKAIITGSSDVHLTTDLIVAMTNNGDIVKYPEFVIPSEDVMYMLIYEGLLSSQDRAIFNRNFEYDGAYTMRYGPYKGTRTRMAIGRTFGNNFIVFRIISDVIPELEQLDIEDEIVEWSHYPNGLFMLCGPTGTGKSTTLASVVRNVQKTTRKKIITIEKPIEYLYPDDTSSLVVQREVGEDTRGFYEGLTSAMRQNPDIILLGEVRNTEEVTELLRAAETGHLAISTMHTNSVSTTINRIMSLFEGNEQRRIMSTLADTLRGIANQVLVKDKHDGRFAVREILSMSKEVKELIISGDVDGIKRYQSKNKSTMEHKLAAATKAGRCYRDEAIQHCVDHDLFNRLMDEED